MAAAWVVAATSEAAVAATMAVADRMAGDTEADMAEHTAAVATTAAEPTRAADMQAAAILDQPPAVLPLLELGPGKDAAAPATLRPAGTALTVMAVHPLAPVEQMLPERAVPHPRPGLAAQTSLLTQRQPMATGTHLDRAHHCLPARTQTESPRSITPQS
jgi:hypothetical protein